MSSLQRYKPKHEPGCNCAVCTTAEFVATMSARADARQKRVHEILNNPFGTRRDSGEWTKERPVKPIDYLKASEGEV